MLLWLQGEQEKASKKKSSFSTAPSPAYNAPEPYSAKACLGNMTPARDPKQKGIVI